MNQTILNSTIETCHKVAKKAIHLYEHLNLTSVELLAYSENATYLARSLETGKRFCLRICRPGYHSMKNEIQSELFWIKSIAEQTSINVALPIKGSNQEYIQNVVDEDTNYSFTCILFEFLAGDEPDIENETELVRVFEKIGEITANLHDFVIQNPDKFLQLKRPIWSYEEILGEFPKWGKWQDGLGMTCERVELFHRVSATIKQRLINFGKNPNRFGLIHGDLRHANLLIENESVKVIDFDDSGFSWYLYDLAASLSFIEHKEYVPQLISSWLKGYRQVRELTQEEEQEIPTFIMMRRLQLIAWIGSRDNETTRAMGIDYTIQTDRLAKRYMQYMDSLSAKELSMFAF